jgi:pyrimidine operon attenuation protein/uracil phosphoribosyltransferase
MSNNTKRIIILTEVELRKTVSRLTSEIIEKLKKE